MAYTPAKKTNTLAFIGLITGIVSLFGLLLCCCSPILTAGWSGVFGLPALILGYLAKQQIDASGNTEGGEEMAIAAMIMGGAGVFMAIVGIVLFILSLIGMIALPALEEFSNSL
jgi:hypothetical protein